MEKETRPGSIEVIAGVMFAGKSEELIRRVRRAVIARRSVQVFTSHLDRRYTGLYSVSSHDGTELDASPVASAAEVFRLTRPGTHLVAVDETQFLDPGIVGVATALAAQGVRVILAGTDTDFRGEPFGSMGALMAVAESVDKLRAVCVVCGDLACRNQRLVDGKPAQWEAPTIMVGGRESYEARCRRCHEVPRVDEDQFLLVNSVSSER
ncbi:MAG TPA: thymidine kinase [Gemmatimonadales bacterium]|nr:thymidine kinase [Gemmatimonadales bacterium]